MVTIDYTGLQLISCSNSFVISRSQPIYCTYLSVGVNTRSYTIGTTNTYYSNAPTLSLDCTIVMPSSQAPVVVSYTFTRNSSPYLVLKATLTAVAVIIPPSAVGIITASTEMAATTTYTFTITIGNPLGQTPKIVLTLPSDITSTNFIANTCTVSLNTVPATTPTCSLLSNTLSITLTAPSSTISSSTIISIVIPNLTNPPTPQNYTFGIQTYYSSSIVNSLV